MNHKHGTRQRKVWRKRHLAVGEDGEILRAELIPFSLKID